LEIRTILTTQMEPGLDAIVRRREARRAAYDRVLADALALDPDQRDELVLALVGSATVAPSSPSSTLRARRVGTYPTLRSAIEAVFADGRARTTGEIFTDAVALRPITKRPSVGSEVARLTGLGVLRRHGRGGRPRYTLATAQEPAV